MVGGGEVGGECGRATGAAARVECGRPGDVALKRSTVLASVLNIERGTNAWGHNSLSILRRPGTRGGGHIRRAYWFSWLASVEGNCGRKACRRVDGHLTDGEPVADHHDLLADGGRIRRYRPRSLRLPPLYPNYLSSGLRHLVLKAVARALLPLAGEREPSAIWFWPTFVFRLVVFSNKFAWLAPVVKGGDWLRSFTSCMIPFVQTQYNLKDAMRCT